MAERKNILTYVNGVPTPMGISWVAAQDAYNVLLRWVGWKVIRETNWAKPEGKYALINYAGWFYVIPFRETDGGASFTADDVPAILANLAKRIPGEPEEL